jgi:DNA-binding NarL/FixJ family response regulator
MLVHRSTLLDALIGYFQLIWSQSIPLLLVEQPASPLLSGDDRAMLAMLLAGLTDQSIAGRLGVGHRSVQRRVRHLMDLAGVETRIQLGWHVHKYRWLGGEDESPPPSDLTVG